MWSVLANVGLRDSFKRRSERHGLGCTPCLTRPAVPPSPCFHLLSPHRTAPHPTSTRPPRIKSCLLSLRLVPSIPSLTRHGVEDVSCVARSVFGVLGALRVSGDSPPSAPAVLPAQGLDQALGGLQPAEESDGFNEEALDVASRPETVEEENEVLFRDACFFALNFKPRTPKTQEEGMPYESMLDCSEFPDFEFTIRRSFPLLMTQAPEMSLRARAIHACQVVANRIPFPSWDEFWPKDPRDKTRWCDENQAMYILPIPTATPHT